MATTAHREVEPLRRVGRPRLQPVTDESIDAREQILGVAARLFCAQGYSATSTRQIAEGVGLRQASLFHYFEKKEDILSELLDRTLCPALALSTWLRKQEENYYAALYSLTWFDVQNLCASPTHISRLQLLPEVREERFARFWRDRDALRRNYLYLIRRIASYNDAALNVEMSCDLVFGLVESVLTWYDHDSSPHPDTVATSIAEATLRMVRIPSRRFTSSTRGARLLLQSYLARPESPTI